MSEEHRSYILIFHDQADNRNRWKTALRVQTSGLLRSATAEALALLRDTALRIDLLVTAAMTDFAGLQLAAEAVELRRDLPVIIVAWAANPVGIQNIITVLPEPVSATELINTARALLSQ